jgi:resuscitation-promoting factor RpfB
MRKLKGLAVLAVAVEGIYAYSGVQHATVTAGHHQAAAAAISGPVTRNANEALANQMAASGYGWTGAQAVCLDELWTEESGFSAYAANPTSDARGIAQKISGWSADYQPGNARQQVSWGLSYIAGRYGTPCVAWAHEKSVSPNWY